MRSLYSKLSGVLGLLIILYALWFLPSDEEPIYFFVGSCFMLLTAFIEVNFYYISLNSLVVVGTILRILNLSALVSLIILLGGALYCGWWNKKNNNIQDRLDLIGYAGLTVLAFSYATQSYIGFVISGLLVSLYCLLDLFRGTKIALLWLILNICFTIAAMRELFFR